MFILDYPIVIFYISMDVDFVLQHGSSGKIHFMEINYQTCSCGMTDGDAFDLDQSKLVLAASLQNNT